MQATEAEKCFCSEIKIQIWAGILMLLVLLNL